MSNLTLIIDDSALCTEARELLEKHHFDFKVVYAADCYGKPTLHTPDHLSIKGIVGIENFVLAMTKVANSADIPRP